MREQVYQYIYERELLKPGDRVAVAVSGGADSVALLRVLLELRGELGIVLHVAHFNHQLRGEESEADERFVAELAIAHGLPFFAGRGDVRRHAEAERRSLEHAARELRYQWLTRLARQEKFDAVVTAHTSDDQAETVLMKFLRGAGTRGLAGIYPRLTMEDILIARPLLETTRSDVERYLRSLNQGWREDHTNSDTQLTRNRIRHELLPLLERDYNPNIRRVLSDAAEVARREEDYWRTHTIEELRKVTTGPHRLSVTKLASLHGSVQRRVLKHFLESQGSPADFSHIESLRHFALGESSAANLSGGWLASCEGTNLLLTPPPVATGTASPYHYLIPIPGEVQVHELQIVVQAILVPDALAINDSPGSLLSRTALGDAVVLRNWLPGDRYRAAYSGSEEKLKRLFSEKKIPAEQRPLWPVAARPEGRIVWVRGFPVAHDFVWKPGSGEAVKIEVRPIY